MRRVLACECGFELFSTDLGELVETARRHALRVHGMDLSVEQVAALVRPVGAATRGTVQDKAEGRQG